MISRPYLDALWTRAARLARVAGVALDELYVEEARRERAWASSDERPTSLVEADAGLSVQLLAGRSFAFGAASGLAAPDLDRLVRETAARGRVADRLNSRRSAPRSPVAPSRASLGALTLVGDLPLSGGGVRLSVELLRSERRFLVRHGDRAARGGSEELAQAVVTAFGERRGRRASIEVRVPLAGGARALEGAVREAREAALRALDARPAPSGKTTVVLGPGSGAAVFHEVLGHPLEADFVASGRSWYRSELAGRKLATEELTITDDPGRAGAPLVIERDDEGARSQRVLLLERGELSGVLLDRATARLAGVRTNGHGRRSSWRAPARPRMTNLVVEAGRHEAADLVGSVRRGVYVSRLAFGRADFATGRFAVAASEAFSVRDGKIGAPLANVHLEGDALSLLASVVAVGSDLAFEPGALPCDKDDEVWVGLAQPTVLLHGIAVG
jgi:predicted Zn-dependent protease